MLLLYLFAAKQVTDTETPRVGALVHDVLQRNLQKGERTTLRLRARVAGGGRHYELTLHPAARLAEDAAALANLLAGAAEIVHEEVGARRGDVTVTCVAVLPTAERRTTYDRRMREVPEPELEPTPAPDGTE